MIVLDASAIVAILAEEPDSKDYSDRLDAMPSSSAGRVASTVTLWEASLALSRLWRIDRVRALAEVRAFLSFAEVTLVAPDADITTLAVEAAERYGIGAGYPGILNLGDCFSYATAKHLGAALLFKGEDFTRTDIAAA